MGWQVYDKYGAAKMAPATVQGSELDYAQIVANSAAITATTEATAITIITGNSVNYDGNKLKIEFYAPGVRIGDTTTLPALLTFVLLRDGVVVGQARTYINSATYSGAPFKLEFFDTPTPGAHQYAIKSYVNATGGTTQSAMVFAGSGGSGTYLPAYLRVTRADPQVVVKYVGVPGALIGQELGYNEKTTDTAGGTAFATLSSITFDGATPILLEAFVSAVNVATNAASIAIEFREDGNPIGRAWIGGSRAAGSTEGVGIARKRFTPSAGAHVYTATIVVVSGTGTATAKAGDGTTTNHEPSSLRATRAA